MNDKERDWQKCRLFFPRKTIEGKWTNSFGQIWRRRDDSGRWEYRQDDETQDDFDGRQW